MESKNRKTTEAREKDEVLGETYEKGTPEPGGDEGRWRFKLASRDEKLRYLKTGERYWYSQDWYGSERRKTPA